MAVTITVAELAAAIRVGSTTEETAEVTRLRTYAIEAITKHLGDSYATTPDVVVNEATVRLVGYLYDLPTASRGDAFANAMRFSGAARMMFPYVVHSFGTTAEATAAAQSAMGSADNPVTGIAVSGTTLTVTFADGTTDTETLPAGGPGGGLDQAAVDARVAAGVQDWAETGNADLIPASKYRAPTSTDRGAPIGATNNDIDEGAGARPSIFLSYTLNHLKRLINRLVPAWARTGNAATLPANKIRDRSLVARMFAVGAVDHNALAANSVRRAAILAEAVDSGKLDPAVAARLLPAVTAADNAKVLTVVSGAWAAADAAGGGATAATVLHESTPTAASPTLSLSRALTAADNNRQLMISVRHVDTGTNQDLVGALIADVEHVLAGSAMLRHDNDASPLNFTALISSAHDSITPTFSAATTGSQTRYVKITLR